MAATTARSRNPLWAFSLKVYRRSEVAAACLALQDRLGLDVNVLLLCLWLADRRALDATRLALGAERASRTWARLVVRRLRDARRRLKKGAPRDVYRRALELELHAERIEQDILFGAVEQSLQSGPSSPSDIAVRTLATYLRRARAKPGPRDVRAILTLLVVVAPKDDPRQLKTTLVAALRAGKRLDPRASGIRAARGRGL